MKTSYVLCAGPYGTISHFLPYQRCGMLSCHLVFLIKLITAVIHRSILTFMTALIVDNVWSNATRNNCSGQDHHDACFAVAKAMLFLVLCFATARFVIFMFQLRRISQALYQAARAESL